MSIRTQALKVMRLAHEKAYTTVYLISPDGKRSTHTDCQFVSDRSLVSPDSGGQAAVASPVATFPRSSLLARTGPYYIPEDGQNWSLAAPLDPDYPNDLTLFAFDGSKARKGGRSLGYVVIELSETEQN